MPFPPGPPIPPGNIPPRMLFDMGKPGGGAIGVFPAEKLGPGPICCCEPGPPRPGG